MTKTCVWQAKKIRVNLVNMPQIRAGARTGKYPDIRHLVIKNRLLLTSLQLEFLSITSNLYLISFRDASICLHVAIVHACIINNNINTVGANDKGRETGVASFTKASYTSSSIVIQVSQSMNEVYMATCRLKLKVT